SWSGCRQEEAMALSEHEQRMLDAIEQGLFEDDPKFASNVDPARIRRRRPILSAALFAVGLIALVVGVVSAQNVLTIGVAISVIGFVLMVGGVALFVYGTPGGHGASNPGDNSKVSSPLSSRMEER